MWLSEQSFNRNEFLSFLNERNILPRALKASMYKITVFISSVGTLVIIVGTLTYII